MLQLRNLLLALDFSPTSEASVPYALSLAEQFGAKLCVLHARVLRREPGIEQADARDPISTRKRFNKLLGPAALRSRGLEPSDFDIELVVERDVEPGPAILNYADENNIDCIVLGTHGRRGIRRLLIGSVAEEVVRLASCPVLTVRQQNAPRTVLPRRIMVPVDYSDHSKMAVRYGRELARQYNANLILLHVVEDFLHPAFYGPQVQSIYDVEPDIEEKAIDHLTDFFEESRGPDVEGEFKAVAGRAGQEISSVAETENIDLLVMSTHGRTGIEQFLMGSVTSRTVPGAPCPVLTVKPFGRSLLQEDTPH